MGFPPKESSQNWTQPSPTIYPKRKRSYHTIGHKKSFQINVIDSETKKEKKKKKNPIWRKYDFAFLIMAFPIQMLIAEHKFHGSVKPSRRSIWVRA